MADFFWFSDVQWVRIEPFLPICTRGMKRLDDRRVSPGLFTRCKAASLGRLSASLWPRKTFYNRFVRCAERASGRTSSARWPGLEMRPTGCSSTAPASRSTAPLAAQKGGLANGIGQTRGGRNTKLHAVCDVRGRPRALLLTPGNAHDMRVSRQCIAAMPPSSELVGDKGCDWTICVSGSLRAAPRPSSRRSATAKSNSTATPQSTASATSSSACSAASKTGAGSPCASTETSKPSWQPSPSRLPSSGGL